MSADPRDDFPADLTKYIMRLKPNQWRALCAEVRWRYIRWDFSPPKNIAPYIELLPDSSGIWITYSKRLTTERRKIVRQAEIARTRKRYIKEKETRRSYMTEYMRDYRQGVRRKSS